MTQGGQVNLNHRIDRSLILMMTDVEAKVRAELKQEALSEGKQQVTQSTLRGVSESRGVSEIIDESSEYLFCQQRYRKSNSE